MAKKDDDKKYKYTKLEITVAGLLVVYLLAVLLLGLWLIWDIFIGRFTWFQGMLTALPVIEGTDIKSIFGLLLLVASSGWMGGAIAAMNSLMGHYAATVENEDPKAQEKNRFHLEWGGRWFWGPWIGAGLSVIVLALVRSGVLVFASSPADAGTISITEKFATIGLGGLVGLGSKDVVDKLIQTLKTWLRSEELPVGELTIGCDKAEDGKTLQLQYGNEVATFTVIPKIAVDWALDPKDEKKSGKITNGVYVSPKDAPAGTTEQLVVLTATSKKDKNRSASTTFLLKA